MSGSCARRPVLGSRVSVSGARQPVLGGVGGVWTGQPGRQSESRPGGPGDSGCPRRSCRRGAVVPGGSWRALFASPPLIFDSNFLQRGLLIPALFLVWFCLYYSCLISALFLDFSFLQHILLIPALFLVYSCLIPCLFLPYFCLIFGFWFSAAYFCLIPGLFLHYFSLIFGIEFSGAYSAYSCLIPGLFLPYSFLIPALFLFICFYFGFLQHIVLIPALFLAYSCFIHFLISAF